jgi:deoxycytidylate deaminase
MAKQNVIALAYSKRGKLLSIGRNSYIKTHPMQARLAYKTGQPHKIYIHAELDALLKAREQPHTLKVFRIGPKGDYLNVKPCPICQLAITEFGVKKIIHT